MRRRHPTPYEYEYKEQRPYKQRLQRNPLLKALDTVLFIAVIILPLIGLALRLFGYPVVPDLWLAGYTAVTQTVAGLLFILFTACGVGGFGKVGYFFTHTRGKRWMTTEEAKGNTYLIGVIMLVMGILISLLTFKML